MIEVFKKFACIQYAFSLAKQITCDFIIILHLPTSLILGSNNSEKVTFIIALIFNSHIAFTPCLNGRKHFYYMVSSIHIGGRNHTSFLIRDKTNWLIGSNLCAGHVKYTTGSGFTFHIEYLTFHQSSFDGFTQAITFNGFCSGTITTSTSKKDCNFGVIFRCNHSKAGCPFTELQKVIITAVYIFCSPNTGG